MPGRPPGVHRLASTVHRAASTGRPGAPGRDSSSARETVQPQISVIYVTIASGWRTTTDANGLQRLSTDANGHSVLGQAPFASDARCAQSESQEPNAAEDVGLVAQDMASMKNAGQRMTGLQAFLRNFGRRIG